jgi:uncharacterized protein (TIGR03067 family)
MYRSPLLLAAVVLSLAFAPAPFPRPGKRDTNESDLKKLQGGWLRVTMTLDGQFRQDNTPITIIQARMQFPAPTDAWTLTLDATKKPKTIDARNVGNPQNVFYGIYQIEGDTLTICWRHNVTVDKRPTNFDRAAPGVWHQIYKRTKR